MSDIMDALLDSTLDDLADLPSFKPFPDGAHKVLATLDTKEITGKPAVELTLKYVEPIELADPAVEAPQPGDSASTLYFLDNEIGQGKFKAIASSFSQALGISGSLREVIEATKEVECIVVCTVTADKKDKDRTYMNIKEVGFI